jgi:hypothetical protein
MNEEKSSADVQQRAAALTRSRRRISNEETRQGNPRRKR